MSTEERGLYLLGQWGSEIAWHEQSTDHFRATGLHWGFNVGTLQCLCEQRGWVQSYMLGPGPWLRSWETRACSHRAPWVCLQWAPASGGGGFHLIWHNADAWSLPWLGTAARWTGCLEMLHAGDADSAPGGISLNPTSTARFTSSCTPRVSLCCSLCFGDAMWGHQHQLRGHIWHGAVFIYSGAMLRQSCCGLCRAELAWEQSAHVCVALTPANLTRWRCPCSWGVRIQLWVSRSKQVLMC